MTAVGLENLKTALGKHLVAARRYVLGLDHAGDVFGHGITEFTFDGSQLVIRPGPNEDYLVIEPGPLDPSGLKPQHWSEVALTTDTWQPRGRLEGVDIFSDGVEDIALLFRFDSGDRFSIVLCDTDVAIGQGLERFAGDPNQTRPVLRDKIQ